MFQRAHDAKCRLMKRALIRPALLSLSFLLPLACDEQDDDSTPDDGLDSGAEEESASNGGEGSEDDGEGSEDDGEVADDGAGNEGDGASNNVAACEALVDDLSCGSTDFSLYVDCSLYATVTCDISDYLGCLDDNFTCTDGIFDASQWSSCASLAQC